LLACAEEHLLPFRAAVERRVQSVELPIVLASQERLGST
jgi:hypothetical protein